MTAERIKFYEDRLKKPIPEPFKGWIEELFEAAKSPKAPKQEPKPKTLYNPPKPDSDYNE